MLELMIIAQKSRTLPLGHKAYLKGTRGFEKVVETFGEDIVGKDGEVDRKLLGPKVFSDKVIMCCHSYFQFGTKWG